MKILLDTTYLLPAVGVAVKELSTDAMLKLIDKGNQIVISQISLFELAAKGAKYVKNGTLKPETVTRGIRALTYNDQIESIPINDTKLLLTAFTLRNMLDDFNDCLILSTALNNCDCIVTEDHEIHGLINRSQYNELQKTMNHEFKISSLHKILLPPKTKEP